LFITLVPCFVSCNTYSFNVTRIFQQPLISSQYSMSSNGGSIFSYNYNTAVVPLFNSNDQIGLLVRSQNNTNSSNPYVVGPSVISFTKCNSLKNGFQEIDWNNVVLSPSSSEDAFGCEDPRVVYNPSNGLYYILYSAVQSDPILSRLALATTPTPWDKNSIIRHGALFPQIKWSKSGSLLIRESGLSYLIWGDSSLVPGLQLATTYDLLNYNYSDEIFLPIRPNNFDSLLVEAGPMPLPISDGNYLFLYNSARHGYPSPKKNWDIQYNVGWVILDGNDPTQILNRCDEPILSPELPWEVGTAPYLGLTPNVVFLEGWIPNGNDSFIVFYGAADSVIGAATLKVIITPD